MKLSINVRELFPEPFFYIDWARKSKNMKIKRRLLKKAIKETKFISTKELKTRIKEKARNNKVA